MSKTFYVYSTLAADTEYVTYREGGGDMPVPESSVVIKGGAGVANDRFVTPRGVVTSVTEEQLQKLQQNKVFQLHEKNGYVQYSEAIVDPDKAAADMTGRDESAPVVPQDLREDEQPKAGDVSEESATATVSKSRKHK